MTLLETVEKDKLNHFVQEMDVSMFLSVGG
jgi:hypothetical protein